MKRIALLLLSIAVVSAVIATADDSLHVDFPKDRLLEIVSNADVHWTREYPGLVPRLSPNAQAILSDKNAVTVGTVREWLADPNRFAVAHVLLTLWGEAGRYPVSASEWNGLRPTLTSGAEGTPTYEAGQMQAIQTRWGRSEGGRSEGVKD